MFAASVLALVVAAMSADPPREPPARLAFGVFGGLSYTLYPRPSGDVAFFLGAALPALPRRHLLGRQYLALGYRGELSYGDAEFAPGVQFHRHHLALMSFVGPRRRILLAGGAGIKAGVAGVGIEAAVQLGYAAVRRDHGSFVLGAQVRQGSWLCDACGVGSFPHFGVFAGWLRLPARDVPVAPPREPPSRAQRPLDVAAPLHLLVRLHGFPLPFSSHNQTEYIPLIPLELQLQHEPRRGVWGGGQIIASAPLPLILGASVFIGHAWRRAGVALELGGGLFPLVAVGLRARFGDLERTHVRARLVIPVLPVSPIPIAELAVLPHIAASRRPLWLAVHFQSYVTILWGTLGARVAFPTRHRLGAHFLHGGVGIAGVVEESAAPAFLLGYELRVNRRAAR